MRSSGREVAGFDTEDDGQGNPFLWCITHESGRYHARTANEFLERLSRMGEDARARGRTLELWATNLEYDLCNTFGPERISEVALRFGRSALVGARWRRIELRDTMRHVPASVAELGELVGLRKREGDLFSAKRSRNFRRYLTRCQRDASITYRFATLLREGYARFKMAPKMTLASTALAIWREGFWKRETVRPSPEIWSAAFEAYHGGRTQAFAAGTFPDVRAIDAASMFPWAMIARPLPLPWGLYRRVRRGARVYANGIYDVRVRSNVALPVLPVRTKAGTVYPNGEWRAWYVGEELLAAMERGVSVYVHQGFEFAEQCEPFKGYVAKMFALKQRARGVNRLLFKLLLNALYGKFGQRGRVVRAMPLAKFMELETAPLEWRAWNGLAIFSEEGTPPPWSNMVWPAFVTARARVRLLAEMERVRAAGGRVLYCDTDSAFFTGAKRLRYPGKATRPGTFENRGTFRSLLLVGKKEYALQRGANVWDIHAKGVPYAERMRYLREGIAEFDRPTRLREAARGGLKPNVWRRVRKQRRVSLIEGASQRDGALPVPRITRGGNVSRK